MSFLFLKKLKKIIKNLKNLFKNLLFFPFLRPPSQLPEGRRPEGRKNENFVVVDFNFGHFCKKSPLDGAFCDSRSVRPLARSGLRGRSCSAQRRARSARTGKVAPPTQSSAAIQRARRNALIFIFIFFSNYYFDFIRELCS